MKKNDAWIGLLAMIALPIFIIMEYPMLALILFCFFFFVFLAVILSSDQRIETNCSLSEIDRMDGVSFERYISEMLKKAGYHSVRMTNTTGDYGVDIVARHNGEVYAFQCKRHAKNVGVKAVQEVYSGKGMYGATKAVVVTNMYFSDNARTLARNLGVELWDRDKPRNMISHQ